MRRAGTPARSAKAAMSRVTIVPTMIRAAFPSPPRFAHPFSTMVERGMGMRAGDGRTGADYSSLEVEME
jgi:hypothetical protein